MRTSFQNRPGGFASNKKLSGWRIFFRRLVVLRRNLAAGWLTAGRKARILRAWRTVSVRGFESHKRVSISGKR